MRPYTEAEKEKIAIGHVHNELIRATEMNGPFNSAHEGYAVILEELDELFDEIKKKSKDRSAEKMFDEAIQVAAMGIRFAMDIILSKLETEA